MATARFERELADERFVFRLSELVELEDSKRVPLNSRDRENRKGPYPYYGATSVMDYVDGYLFDGIRVLLGEDGTVIREDGRPVLQYVWGKYWVNNHAHILKAKTDYSLEAIYIALARTAINHIVTGAVQMKISQKNLNGLEVELPSRESLDYLKDVFSLYRNNVEESKRLERLRDALLPKLMSGEIDVSKVDLTQLNSHLAEYRPPCRGLRSLVLPGLVANLFCVWSESGQQSRFQTFAARS
ncbi:restriction endonuclease subunit S [Parolsenella sp. LCP21S3_E11]|uniref:restriction endonuclease subunit S n=1 Tax=Parolsenella sp. LCP21S3_E11 TaxID=3438797 RepID=UPI003F95A0AF